MGRFWKYLLSWKQTIYVFLTSQSSSARKLEKCLEILLERGKCEEKNVCVTSLLLFALLHRRPSLLAKSQASAFIPSPFFFLLSSRLPVNEISIKTVHSFPYPFIEVWPTVGLAWFGLTYLIWLNDRCASDHFLFKGKTSDFCELKKRRIITEGHLFLISDFFFRKIESGKYEI